MKISYCSGLKIFILLILIEDWQESVHTELTWRISFTGKTTIIECHELEGAHKAHRVPTPVWAGTGQPKS